MVAKTAFGQRGVDFGLMADQENGGDVFVVLQRLFDAGNDNAAAVVAAHDIHCNSHKSVIRELREFPRIYSEIKSAAIRETRELKSGFFYAPAVTVKTWRPL